MISDESDGILFGIKTDLERSLSIEFQHPEVKPMAFPLIYGEYDALGYIPAEHADAVENIPVEISPDNEFSTGSHEIQADSISRSAARVDSDTFDLRIFCSVECWMMLIGTGIWENLGIIIGILSLLIAFFGRKRIQDALGLRRERGDEVDVETSERADAGTNSSEPPDADAVGDGQRPEG
ncbi:hypothetical protein [Halorussus lipolyticus]|uniref:hypothetical protein n=1 Tax=Halorussus lipolyticus TaxID=3034024 RepID=UPI0023E82D5A|nr:hypothetical protein [Halorussus sp. DT80]